MLKPLRIAHELPHCRIRLIGHQRQFNEDQTAIRNAYKLTTQMGAQPNRTTYARFAATDSAPGHKTIIHPQPGEGEMAADGICLDATFNSGAFGYTGDCPALILSNTHTKRVLLAHCGVWALRPPAGCPGCTSNIVCHAVRAVGGQEHPEAVHAFITGGICGDCFVNETDTHRARVQPLLDTFGETIFTDEARGCVNLIALIQQQLQGYGVPEAQVVHDGYCTYETAGLASHRRGEPARNLVAVATR